MTNPLISVIVPVYNAEAYLDRCVESVLEQDHTNFELILVDDGSPDQCGRMCDEWSKKDKRVIPLHKTNGGQSSARNMGLDRARGEYIAFVDSDDWVTSDYLSYMLSLFPEKSAARLKCSFVACNHTILRGGRRITACDIQTSEKTLTRREAFEDVLFHGCMDVAPWAKLYKRSVFAYLRYPEGRLFEDTWLFGDILTMTDTVVFGNKSCYFYEMHGESTVNQGFREKNLEYIEAAEKLAKDAVKEDLANEIGGARRVNHARLSVLRYMERCEAKYRPIQQELRNAILTEANLYIQDPRTPKRDRAAVALLKLGFPAFYAGWRLYGRLRS